MKMFLYYLCTLRDGRKDNTPVLGGTHYHRDQLLLVIEAKDAEHAARALNTKIIGSFDRSDAKLPTGGLPDIYYTSDYYGGGKHPFNHPEGYFFLALKEMRDKDEITFPDLAKKIHFKITANPNI